MPFTAKQRALFHARAERGEKGMAKLADEADEYAAMGDELPPVGVGGTAAHIIRARQDEEDENEDVEPWSSLRGK